jgi:membrane protease YdiL (CAAX protease family)
MNPEPQTLRFESILGFQVGVLLLGVMIGYFGGLVPQTPWDLTLQTTPTVTWVGFGSRVAVLTGVGFAGLMMTGLWILSRADFAWLRRIDQILQEVLIPSLRRYRLWQLGVLALIAGVGEELCFRWAIQGVIEPWIDDLVGAMERLWGRPDELKGVVPELRGDGLGRAWGVFGMASLVSAMLFGLCHAVTRAYWILATGIGFVFSLIAGTGGGLVGAIIAHAVYDFFAFLWLCRSGREAARAAAES